MPPLPCNAALLLVPVLAACSNHQPAATQAPPANPSVTPVPLPGGEAGIGFDDMQYEPALKRVLVGAGRTGALDLIDPASGAIEQVTGFTAEVSYGGGHGEGTTS